jgi:hypothetical protein
LFLIQIDCQQIEVHRRALLNIKQQIEERVTVLPARQADHYSIAVFNHLKILDCLAHAAQQSGPDLAVDKHPYQDATRFLFLTRIRAAIAVALFQFSLRKICNFCAFAVNIRLKTFTAETQRTLSIRGDFESGSAAGVSAHLSLRAQETFETMRRECKVLSWTKQLQSSRHFLREFLR